MDANQTRFHMLLGESDWRAVLGRAAATGEESHVVWDDASGSVILARQLFRFERSPVDVPPSLERRNGAAVDRYGHWYWISADGYEIFTLPAGLKEPRRFWPAGKLRPATSGPGDFTPAEPHEVPSDVPMRGLAVTDEHYLVAGTLDPAGLVIFDLHAGGPPLWLAWPAEVPFAPYDMAKGPGGRLYILDREHLRYWVLDRNFQVLRWDQENVEIKPPHAFHFHPERGCARQPKPAKSFPTGMKLRDAASLAAENPIAIEALPDGSVLILEAGGGDARVLRYVGASLQGAAALTGVLGTDDAVYYDRDERGVVTWVPLAEKPRPRFARAGVLPEVGAPLEVSGFAGLAFDGKERGCVWHRVMLDAVIPEGAVIAVESRAADDLSLLSAMPWQKEPDPYLRPMGSEIPFYRPYSDQGRKGHQGDGTWELLLQQARGRYLQLRISLMGTGRNTPRLRAVRVYYPRFSYLKNYLPAVYREDPDSASFLERFLANIEGIFTALEDRISHAQALFDPRTVPAESLEWLAGWLGLALDSSWDENRKRLLIRHAPQMFAERGTLAGIIRAIRLATDPSPDDSLFTEPVLGEYELATGRGRARSVRIVEQFRTRQRPGVVFGDPSEVEGPGVTAPWMPWSPAHGPEPLHQRYRAFLLDRYGDVDAINRALGTSYASVEAIEFPPVMPESFAEAEVWRTFVRAAIGFPYAAVDGSDLGAYQRFLEHRYKRLDAFFAAAPEYAAAGAKAFSDVPMPVRLPASRRALLDWIQFASVYLPALKRAHRFTVLVPVWGEVAMGPDPEVVRRVVELEKPAHTEFEIKPYWAMFRVGEARLGIDTQLGQSSRLAAAIVGDGSLGEQYLAYAHPWNVRERTILDRDRVS